MMKRMVFGSESGFIITKHDSLAGSFAFLLIANEFKLVYAYHSLAYSNCFSKIMNCS